jgi:hypothetical protein
MQGLLWDIQQQHQVRGIWSCLLHNAFRSVSQQAHAHMGIRFVSVTTCQFIRFGAIWARLACLFTLYMQPACLFFLIGGTGCTV